MSLIAFIKWQAYVDYGVEEFGLFFWSVNLSLRRRRPLVKISFWLYMIKSRLLGASLQYGSAAATLVLLRKPALYIEGVGRRLYPQLDMENGETAGRG